MNYGNAEIGNPLDVLHFNLIPLSNFAEFVHIKARARLLNLLINYEKFKVLIINMWMPKIALNFRVCV